MKRTLEHRISLLERAHPASDVPRVIVGARPLPETPSREAVERWLKAGTAHIAFSRNAVMYDGGSAKLTTAEWQRTYALLTLQ